MKKIIALLTFCTMITCAFTSCGKDEAEESTEKSVSVSESETSVTETETEEDTTEETTTESVTEEETTEAVTESENFDSKVLGMWYTVYEDGDFLGVNIKDDGKVDMLIDVTEMTHLTADGGIFMNGDIFESECIDYDGKNLVITINGKEAFNMTKDSGDAKSYDGEYTLKSGVMYDSVSNDGNYDVGVIIKGEVMLATCRNMISCKTDKGIVSISGLKNIDYDFDNTDLEYEVSGDTITLFEANEDGSDLILKRLNLETYKPSVKTSTESNTSAENSEVENNENEVSDNEPVSDDNRNTDGSIVGMWISPDDSSYGFHFGENKKCGILVDATEMVHFTSDGKFFMSELTIEPDGISYDGTNLSITVMENDILTMTRNDGNNSESFDGSYTLVSGAFYDGMVMSMCDSFGIDEETATIYAIVSGEQMYIELANIFDYSAEDGLLILNGLDNLDIPSGSYVEYKLSDNQLIIINENGIEEVFEKVNLS